MVGLMLGTTIIAAALTTGDTMSHTIRATVGRDARRDRRDDRAEGRRRRHPGGARGRDRHRLDRRVGGRPRRVGRRWLGPRRRRDRRDRRAGRGPGAGAGSAASRASSSSPATRRGWTGSRRSVAPTGPRSRSPTCGPREVYLNAKAATELRVEAGDPISSTPAGPPSSARVRDVVRFDGAGTADASLLMSLDQAQRLFDHEGQVKVVPSRIAEGTSPEPALSDEVVALLQPVGEGSSGSRSRRSRRTRSRTPTRPETHSWPSSRRSGRSRSPRASS